MKFAPLWLPLHRRLETFAVLQWMLSTFLLGPVAILCFAYVLYSSLLRPLGLLYLVWYIYDYSTPHSGGYRLDFVRRFKIWTHYKNFFPVTMVKTADLNPDNSYIFGYHPHGILGFGAWSSFATTASSFKQFFPNIVPKMFTLSFFFYIPVVREYVMCCGVLPCSKKSIASVIKHKGNAAIIVIGGASEALLSDPDTHTVVLKNRKGFIKLALNNGSSLVPVYSFGENNVYETFTFKEDNWIYIFQRKFKKYMGFSTPLFRGRGIFQYSFGLIPFRKPIFVVVGAPIKVEKNECPTQQQVDDLHATYMNNLSDLFEEHKSNYGLDKAQHLSII